MSLQVEKLENNMAKLTIEVPADDLEKALQSAYMKQKNKIAMPGFRKGKVPRQMIEKMYGPEIFYDDAANALIPKAYSEAYEECELEIVSRPEINVVQIEKGKSFIFTADVATKPEVKLGEYKGLEVDKVSTRVTQKEVDAKIQEEAEKNAREVVVTDRAVADGDEVILDFEGFVDGEAFEGGKGENYPLTIGSGSFIPGFEEQLVGAEAEKEVEVKVTFPEDYHAEELKGKEAVFKCTVHEIKAKELPEIDDEFAAEVSEFDTLEEYKADVKAKIKEQKAADGKRNQEDQAVEQAVKNAEYEIPQPMIETQTTQMVEDFAQRIQSQGITLEQYFQFTGLTAEKMMEDMRPQAIKRIETRLVLEAVAKAENIEITDEKIDEELAKMAESYNMEVEKLKEFMGENEKKQMKIVAQLLFLEAEDPEKDIHLYINSPGGSVTAGMAIYDTMQYIKCDIETICIGMAASMGSFLLTGGTKGKRLALPNSEIMIHQPLGGAQGQATEIQIAADHILKTRQKLNQILAENTGQPLEVINADTERDNFMTAEEAKAYGLIDEVIKNR